MKKILEIIQEGYDKRDPKFIDYLYENTFVKDDDVSVLGTSMNELCLGVDQVKEIFTDDWEGWGDLKIETNPEIFNVHGDTAWFKTKGTVKYSFTNDDDRKGRYVDFVKNNLSDEEMTPIQKLALSNLGLTLTYFRRDENERDEYWPIGLSGYLKKDEGEWKIHSLHFSHETPDFPDLRLEDSKHLIEEDGKPVVSKNKALLINHLEANKAYFEKSLQLHTLDNYKVDGDVVYETVGDDQWIIFEGHIEVDDSMDQIIDKGIQYANDILNSEKLDDQKLFEVQRLFTYLYKAMNHGDRFTYPVRATALVSNNQVIEVDVSHPFYWIFEGKL